MLRHIRHDIFYAGLSYIILEVAKLPFIEAYSAALEEGKMTLLWTLMKKNRQVIVPNILVGRNL